jgi:hypothetical protein
MDKLTTKGGNAIQKYACQPARKSQHMILCKILKFWTPIPGILHSCQW